MWTIWSSFANNARLVNLHHTSWDSRIHTSPSNEHHFKSFHCCHSHWANHKQILTWTELCQGLALSTCSGLPATWWHVKFLFVLRDPTSFTIKLIISKITQTKLSLLETCLQLAIWLYNAIYCFTNSSSFPFHHFGSTATLEKNKSCFSWFYHQSGGSR